MLDGGFALLSRLAVEDEVAGGALAAVPCATSTCTASCASCALGARPGSASAFWDWLREHARSPMMRRMTDTAELLALAERAARAAGALLAERVHGPVSGLEYKSSATDPVSDADRDAEAAILALLRAERPGRRACSARRARPRPARAGCAG